ncbi:MAG: hypothetical protein RIK87_06085 [Fuerstiella sp.]
MAQNKNGPVIGLSIFILLSVVLAVFLYMTHADNQQIRSQLTAAANDKQTDKSTINDQIAQLNLLKELSGGYGPTEDVGHGDPNDTAGINFKIRDLISKKAADNTNTPPNLEAALLKTAAESDNHNFAASERQQQLAMKAVELQQTIVRKDLEIDKHREAREKAEQELVKQETAHSEEMARLEQQNDQLRNEKTAIEQEYRDYQVRAEREMQDLNDDINGYRDAVVSLRQLLREKEDPTFFKPDGFINTVDHVQGLCYINLGDADGLRVGVSFSVYTQDNSGVGRASTDDIKGKIEVVRILGPHQAAASLVDEKPGNPIATNDPIFSPVFQSGQALEVAVVGRLTVDGLDRDQFRRMVSASGSKIAVAVNELGEFTDGYGNIITAEEAKSRITSRVRFIVIADLGDQETKDTELEKLYRAIFDNAAILRKEAEKLGIYEVGLSTFLEHIGYSRKQVSWTPESSTGFPGRLTNGARSSTVNGTVGNRESSAVIGGRFSQRRTPSMVSGGTTSKAYSN